ncbi:transmembrane signal receptor [Lithospermum erythrorhizon]|uniref:Transmembrane signal receptor n=1 Tax=Lithospermum erythrorhizon TaxID=34254 RepID=A0AAV3NXN8_LITER
MLVYVDDILVTGTCSRVVSAFIAALNARFVTGDLGDLNFFLGIKVVSRPDGSLLLSQRQYMVDILAKSNMLACKPAFTPLPITPVPISREDAPPDPTTYRQILGSLHYLTLTCLDLSFAVNKACQYMHDPQVEHMVMVKRILHYVKAMLDLGLVIIPSYFSVQAFSDADWADSVSNRRSTGGYLVYMGPNLVSWQSKKQCTVARSSIECEYKALANCAAELSWLVSLLGELHVPISAAPVLWCDNLGATFLSANPVFHARTKHIEIDFHFVREKVARKELVVRFISTKESLADILTKPLSHVRFKFFIAKLRLVCRVTSACEGSIGRDAPP